MDAVINFFKEFSSMLPTIKVMDIVDILVVAFLIYKVICGSGGLLAGLRFVRERQPEELLAEERALTALAARGLRQLPGVEVFTGPGQSGVLSFRCRDLDCEEAAACLAEAGIAVRAGLHCAPMAHRSGGTLETGTVRVSFSAFNTSAEVRQFLQVCRTAFLPG